MSRELYKAQLVGHWHRKSARKQHQQPEWDWKRPLTWAYKSSIHQKTPGRLRWSRLSKSFYITAFELYCFTYSHLLPSIVAVHGLNGDRKNTWTNHKTNAFWLKDFLPLDVPNARVMTFGYNADAAFGNTTADIIDHAKGLLSSLVDKREEDDVRWNSILETSKAKCVLRSCTDR